jgi:hypothetical protein
VGLRSSCGRDRAPAAAHARETLKKSQFPEGPARKSACQRARMCYFPRRFSIKRLQSHRVSQR